MKKNYFVKMALVVLFSISILVATSSVQAATYFANDTTVVTATAGKLRDYNAYKLCKYATSEIFIGLPYIWRGSTLKGFDCSGYTQFVFAHFGIQLEHYTYSQMQVGTPVSYKDLKPADLVFFYGGGHVGIFIGNGQFVHSSNKGLRISSFSGCNEGNYWYSKYYCARRILK